MMNPANGQLDTLPMAVRGGEDTINRRAPAWDWWLVIVLVGLWSVFIGWLVILRHLALKTEFDVAVYSHVLWTTTQGHPFFNSLVEGTTNYLSHHFVPLLIVLTPLYSVWPDPRVLLSAQTVALAASVLPLYAFARGRLRPWLALLIVVAFLLSPLVHYVALADFHEITLAVPLLMAAGAALLERRSRAVVVWLGLALLAKEEVVLIAIGFGLYALLIQRRWRFGILLTAGAVAWGVLLFGVIMPLLDISRTGVGFLWRYKSLGDTPAQVLGTFLTRPATVFVLLSAKPRLTFIWQVLAPLAGLPLLGLPAFLLALIPLGYLLLSDYAFQFSIRYHYTAPMIPFLFLATVVALQRLQGWSRWLAITGAAMLLAATLITAWRWSPLPEGDAYRAEEFQVTAEARDARALFATIPADARVAANKYFQPWLANRWRLGDLDVLPYQQFPAEGPPDYLVARAVGTYALGPPLYPWLVADTGADPLRVPRYELIASTPPLTAIGGASPGGIELWKRRSPAADVLLARYDAPFERGLTLVGAGLPPEAGDWGDTIRVSPGVTLPVWMAWRSASPLDRRITFSLHLLDEASRLVAQADSEMAAGRFPTTLWHTWMDKPVLADEFPLALPPDLPPGRYQLLAGAFETESVAPLSRPDGAQWIPLTTIEIKR